jgi:hypothetical protein
VSDQAAPSRFDSYRRRLMVAAVASLGLHLFLFHGLTWLKLGGVSPRPFGRVSESPQPTKPRRQADFSLRVAKTPDRQRPAHERPLEVPRSAAKPERRPPQQRPLEATRRQQPEERQRVVTAPTPRPRERSASAAADSTSLPRRSATPSDQPTTAATADALRPPTASSPAARLQPRAASLPPRSVDTSGPIAGRWRPREVALLERLSSGAPERATASPAVAPSPNASSLPRAAAPTATAEANVRVAALPAAPRAGGPVVPAVPQPGPMAARLVSPRGSLTAGSGIRSSTATVTTARTEAGGDNVSDRPAPLATATGLAGNRGGSTMVEVTATVPDSAAGAAATSLERQTKLLGTLADAGVATGAAPIRTPAPPGSGAPSEMDDARGTGSSARMAGPAQIDRLAASLARGAGGGLNVSSRGLPDGDPAGDEAEERLSVAEDLFRSRSAVSTAGSAIPSRSGPTLDRVAAAALPTDGRVRDVAEAFAGRLADRRMASSGAKVADREALVQADAMIERGLEFLARSQQPDGRWSLGTFTGSTPADAPRLTCDTAATGLALLSFLGAGQDHFAGSYRDSIRRGIEWLLAVQQPNGDLYLAADELSNSCGWMYSHGIATMALCEAVGMTGDPLVRPAAERACRFVTASQHPQYGGWRYTPGTDADLSVSGWMLVALRSGKLAGLSVDPRSFVRVATLVEQSSSPVDLARYTYNPRDAQQRRSQLSIACMTAVGGLMRLHTGIRATDPRVTRPADVLAALEPSYGSPTERTRDAYLWYYASQVLVHTGGRSWERWYRSLVDLLAEHQERNGPRAGSWDPLGEVPDRWGHYGGRIYVTALHLLALEVPARHLPTYSAAVAAP